MAFGPTEYSFLKKPTSSSQSLFTERILSVSWETIRDEIFTQILLSNIFLELGVDLMKRLITDSSAYIMYLIKDESQYKKIQLKLNKSDHI